MKQTFNNYLFLLEESNDDIFKLEIPKGVIKQDFLYMGVIVSDDKTTLTGCLPDLVNATVSYNIFTKAEVNANASIDSDYEITKFVSARSKASLLVVVPKLAEEEKFTISSDITSNRALSGSTFVKVIHLKGDDPLKWDIAGVDDIMPNYFPKELNDIKLLYLRPLDTSTFTLEDNLDYQFLEEYLVNVSSEQQKAKQVTMYHLPKPVNGLLIIYQNGYVRLDPQNASNRLNVISAPLGSTMNEKRINAFRSAVAYVRRVL